MKDENYPEYDREGFGVKPAFPSKESVIKDELLAEKQRQLKKNDIIDILSTPAGMRLFQNMMIEGGVFEEKLATNSTIYTNSAFRCFALRYYNLACEANESIGRRLGPPYEEFPYSIEDKSK
jgi:hypothetical protein